MFTVRLVSAYSDVQKDRKLPTVSDTHNHLQDLFQMRPRERARENRRNTYLQLGNANGLLLISMYIEGFYMLSLCKTRCNGRCYNKY